VILHDADRPFVERGVYYIQYGELVDGYRHAYYDEKRRRVRYSRTRDHPHDPKCPGCGEEP
jgi:hypothetical protein